MKSNTSNMQADEAATVLTTVEAARYVRLGKPTLERFRLTGEGPKFCKLGGAVRYRRLDLDRWLDSRLIRSTSELTK
jgi:excisionase family DNA binding protein